MAEQILVKGESKQEKYQSLIPQIKALVEGERDVVANIANIVAALKQNMEFFWVGVYFVKGNELVLGPFQGTVACTRISFGKGVCGAAWENKKIIVVEDVDKFPCHIACSTESKSEIVLPAFNKNGEVVLVLDIDSNQLSEFDKTDEKYLSEIVTIIESVFANG